jgi:hypothetical protein
MTAMLAGIIGGTGQMGRFFAKVFKQAGWEVIVSGTKTPLTSRDVAEMADLIMVSVPIRTTVGVIREVAPLLSEEQVLCDLTSLKVEPVRAMLASRAEVIGLHPMFGPGAVSLRGQTIVATRQGAARYPRRPLSIFRDRERRYLSTPESTPGYGGDPGAYSLRDAREGGGLADRRRRRGALRHEPRLPGSRWGSSGGPRRTRLTGHLR